MPIGLGSGLFAICLPSEKVNYCFNPSFELGTQYWGTSSSGAIGTSSAFQQFGAWSCICTPDSGLSAGIRGGNVPLIDGDYAVSAFVRGAAGIQYNLEIAPAPTGNALGSVIFTGGGTWHWYTFPYTEAGGGGGTVTRAVVVRKRSDASVAPFYVDGVKVEPGSVTSYIDGDQPGCQWLGAPHQSASYRSSQTRSGGSIIALADLGLQVDQMLGVGVAPIEVSTQSYAITDGAQFQRQRTAQRKFTLTAKPIVGTSTADFHIVRRTLYDALKPDAVTPQQPVRLIYYGAVGTQYIDAYYDKGLELGNMDGPMAENAAISFISTDPYWYSMTQQGTTLPARTSLGSVNFLAWRDGLGKWGTMGAAGVTVNAPAAGITPIQRMAFAPSGTLYFAGTFTTLAGTTASSLGWYTPSNNAFGTILGAPAGQMFFSLAMLPDETFYTAGTYTQGGGTTGNNFVSVYNKAVSGRTIGTLIGGTINAQVRTLLYTPTGTLVAGGEFLSVAGTVIPRAAFYANGGWGSFTGGTVGAAASSDFVAALAYGLDGAIHIGGRYTSIGGTTARGLGFTKDGTFGTYTGALSDGGTICYDLSVGPDGRVYTGGDYGSVGGIASPSVSVYNGVVNSALGGGIPRTGTAEIHSVNALPDGRVFFGGTWQGTAGGIPTPDNVTVWNGYTFLPLDVDLPGNSIVGDVLISTSGTLYCAHRNSGTGYAASVTTIANSGRAEAYPILRMRNLANPGTIVRPYQLINTLIGAGLYFNLGILPGEVLTLTLEPGQRSFQSNYRGNLFGAILPGSNLAAFNLLSGTNYVSFFGDNDLIEASFFWQPKGPAIDSGTVF